MEGITLTVILGQFPRILPWMRFAALGLSIIFRTAHTPRLMTVMKMRVPVLPAFTTLHKPRQRPHGIGKIQTFSLHFCSEIHLAF